MIFGIGTDIVSISRTQSALDRFGERFAAKILSDTELEIFKQSMMPANHLAKRFAAKEAAVKALGLGFREGISMKHIQVHNDELGKPYLEFHGRAAELALELGVGDGYISISDEKDYALAFVTLIRRTPF